MTGHSTRTPRSSEHAVLRILIADDHHIVRQGLIKLLQEQFSRAVFGEASTAEEVLARLTGPPWSVIVLDINMPGRSGLEILKDIRGAAPNTPVLVLSMYPEDQFALRVLKGGAAGYLTKERASEELVAAIQRVIDGRPYITTSIAEIMTLDLRRDDPRPMHADLSDREFEVFRLIAAGSQVSEIAERLSLSVKTVSTYRSRILEKLGLQNNAQLIRYAISNGLVD